jgi:hypothetical protein
MQNLTKLKKIIFFWLGSLQNGKNCYNSSEFGDLSKQIRRPEATKKICGILRFSVDCRKVNVLKFKHSSGLG